MYTQHPETLDQMVAYHHERLEASMLAAESDRAVWLKYRARFGSLLITFGQRLRDDGIRDLMPAPPSTRPMTSSLHMTSQGKCA